MKGKRIAALLLAGVMAVTTLGGCGLNKNAIVATMDGQDVTLGLVNFMCRYQQALYDDTYAYYSYYYGYDFVWTEDLYGSGSTAQEDLKDSIMEMVHEYYTVQQHMDDYGVTITDDEQTAISEAAAEFMESNSDEAIQKLGATQEIVEEFLTLYTIRAKMYDAVIQDANVEVTDEEANMRGYTYVRQYLVGYYDDDSNYNYYTDDDIEAFTEDFEAMLAAVQDGEDYDDVIDEYGYTSSYNTYAADDDSLDEDLKDALDGMSEGDVEMVTLDSYLYLVRLDAETDEDATEENRESLIEEGEEEYYEEVLAGWQTDDGWTIKKGVLRRIKFKNLFTTVTESSEDEDTDSTDEDATEEVDENLDATELEDIGEYAVSESEDAEEASEDVTQVEAIATTEATE